MNKIISMVIMTLCHFLYSIYKNDILYIKGIGRHYPRYLLYTEDETIYEKMEVF